MSTEVVESTSLSEITDLLPILRGEAELPISDSEASQYESVERILQAKDVDELLEESSSVSTRDLVGEVITIRDAQLKRGTMGGSNVYMVLLAEHETGELIRVNTSSVQIMCKVWQAYRRGWMPITVRITQLGSGKEGQSPPLTLTKP